MSVLFVSDLHLEAARPEIFAAFITLLRGEARDAKALYILGDLFDAWVGDDDDAPLAVAAIDELAALSACGTEIYFQHGNRDFLVGRAFAQRAAMVLLPEEHEIACGEQRVLLMHGDSLCTDDVEYQRFRAASRAVAWRSAMLAQPLEARRALARQARDASAAHIATTSLAIMDVNETAVAATMAAHGVELLVHGHTHRPAVHDYPNGARRYVLAPWHDRGSALRMVSAGGTAHFSELSLPFGP